MAEFETTCPFCNVAIIADTQYAGMEVECPDCQKIFVLNTPNEADKKSEAEEVSDGTQESPPPTQAEGITDNQIHFVCPICGTVTQLSESMQGKKYECKVCCEVSTVVATEEKKCPYCGESIKIQAKICKFCKKDVTQAPIAEQKDFIFFCPECDTMAMLPESLKGKEYECPACGETSIATPSEERKCPLCGEKIKIKATICKHCKQKIPAIDTNSKSKGKLQHDVRGSGNKSTNSFNYLSKTFSNLSNLDSGNSGADLYINQQFVTRITYLNICFLLCSIISLWLGITDIIGIVLALQMLCCFLKAVPPYKDKITTFKAVANLFIPLFGVYWAYKVYSFLSAHYQHYTSSKLKVFAIAPCVLSAIINLKIILLLLLLENDDLGLALLFTRVGLALTLIKLAGCLALFIWHNQMKNATRNFIRRTGILTETCPPSRGFFHIPVTVKSLFCIVASLAAIAVAIVLIVYPNSKPNQPESKSAQSSSIKHNLTIDVKSYMHSFATDATHRAKLYILRYDSQLWTQLNSEVSEIRNKRRNTNLKPTEFLKDVSSFAVQLILLLNNFNNTWETEFVINSKNVVQSYEITGFPEKTISLPEGKYIILCWSTEKYLYAYMEEVNLNKAVTVTIDSEK